MIQPILGPKTERHTADHWNRDRARFDRTGWMVWDPDGWPRNDPERFQKEFFEDMITEEEFNQHVGASTIGPWLWGPG